MEEVIRTYLNWASSTLSKEERLSIANKFELQFFGPDKWESGWPIYECEFREKINIMYIDICPINLEKNLALLHIKETLGLISHYKFQSQRCKNVYEARRTFHEILACIPKPKLIRYEN